MAGVSKKQLLDTSEIGLLGSNRPISETRAPWCCYLFIFSFTLSLLLVDKWLPVL